MLREGGVPASSDRKWEKEWDDGGHVNSLYLIDLENHLHVVFSFPVDCRPRDTLSLQTID